MADSPVTGVLFPDIREPFRSVFINIAQGIHEGVGNEVVIRALAEDTEVEDIRDWIDRSRIESLIVLGSRGRALSDELSETLPVVIGGIHMSPGLDSNQYTGIALSPHPSSLLHRLKALEPRVEQVNVVYHQEREQWMIDHAIEPAQRLGITLNPMPVEGLQEAAQRYREILSTQNSGTEALWLSQSSAVLDENAILPMILREAWNRRLIVFSNNPSHVRRGILFAQYPDNHEMGRSLGSLAVKLHADRADNERFTGQGVEPLHHLLTAFNVRTAGHLGIRHTRAMLNEFDLIFPSL